MESFWYPGVCIDETPSDPGRTQSDMDGQVSGGASKHRIQNFPSGPFRLLRTNILI